MSVVVVAMSVVVAVDRRSRGDYQVVADIRDDLVGHWGPRKAGSLRDYHHVLGDIRYDLVGHRGIPYPECYIQF